MTEANSNDITEHPHDDKPRPYVCTVCDKRFTRKQLLNDHKISHTGESCIPAVSVGNVLQIRIT